MAIHVHTPAFRPVLRRTFADEVAASAHREQAAPRTTSSPGIAQLWRESLQTFSAHSVAVLLCILSGLMSPFLVGHWIATQAVLQNMDWVGPVPALQEKLTLNTLAMLACAGWLTTALARGVITGLALRGNAGNAIRETLAHLPALLISTLAYSVVIAICLLGLSPIVSSERVAGDESALLSWSGWENALSSAGQHIAGEPLSPLLPDAGAPFALLLPAAQDTLARHPAPAGEYDRRLIENNNMPQPQSPLEAFATNQPDVLRVVVVASLAMLIIAETLLRFCVVMTFEPLERIAASDPKQGGYPLQWFAVFAPLIASVRFGWRHFGAITLHTWVLRIAGAALVLLLVKLPMAAALHIAMPALLAFIGKTPLLPVLSFVQLGLAALVAGIVLAFSTIYDARLFMALRCVSH